MINEILVKNRKYYSLIIKYENQIYIFIMNRYYSQYSYLYTEQHMINILQFQLRRMSIHLAHKVIYTYIFKQIFTLIIKLFYSKNIKIILVF